jgi:hypothetical protein
MQMGWALNGSHSSDCDPAPGKPRHPHPHPHPHPPSNVYSVNTAAMMRVITV